MEFVDRISFWESGQLYSADGSVTPPPAPGDYPEVHYDIARIRATVDRDSLGRGPSSLWRYAPLLPVEDTINAVTLGEGWTPLLPLHGIGAELNCPHLYAKDEGRNPSGTFKDRGASVAVTRHRELGVQTIIHNSSGNAGGAMAIYAARAGIRCINLLPDDVLPASLQQSVLAGAETLIFRRPWQESGAAVAKAAEENGWFNIGTLKEPYRLEGKKTMGYEIAEQLGWSLPDAIVYPTGGGLGAIAIYKAFRELQALGWVEPGPLPKLIATQYEGCAPIVRAFLENAEQAALWTELDVPPGGLKSTRPPGDKAVLKLIRETGGTAVAVSTANALGATAQITRAEGILACPESATTLVGLKVVLDSGIVPRDARIVVMITGSGLKSIPILPDAEVPSIGSQMSFH